MYAAAARVCSMPWGSNRSSVAETHSQKALRANYAAIVLYCAIAVIWWTLDRAAKGMADAVPPGTVIVPDVLGLFEFKLVHNTGAAWGMFSDSTTMLGAFSCLVCIAIAIYYLALRKGRGHLLETIGLALVFAGGLGNAFDRLTMGYVVDFINATFMSFPVFNIADIGVTCGIALFLIGYMLHGAHAEAEADHV